MKRRFYNSHNRCRRIIPVLLLAAMLVLPSAHAAPGDLDTSFNAPNGFNTVPGAQFFDVAIQPDGKILAAGVTENGAPPKLIVARFNVDGTLDSGFGTAGVASATASTSGAGITIQADGKIVAAGFKSNFSAGSDFFVMRLEPDGDVDTGFGQNGSTTVDFSGRSDFAGGVVIGPGGSIVVAGTTTLINSGDPRYAIARLDSTGNLDTTFGIGGKVATESGGGVEAAVLGDGRILVCGSGGLLRYTSNGSLDLTFGGGDGIANIDISARSLAVQTNGFILVAGAVANPPGLPEPALARVDPNGALDTSFDGDGIAPPTLAGNVQMTDVAVQSDGGIITVGTVDITGNDERIFLSRYTSSGSPDPSFGSAGNVITDFPGGETVNVAIQSDGKIVIASIFFSPATGIAGLVARYLGSGALPPPPPTFDICVERGLRMFKFNSATGAYEFRDCAKGFVLSGTGIITVNFCKLTLRDTEPNPNPDSDDGDDVNETIDVLVKVNTCTKLGTVSLTTNSQAGSYAYSDDDITNGTCVCPAAL
jgi:uncharacterized delta-60 repeat protein